MQIFSPNMLKTFEECPKKYEFRYVQKLSVPQPVKIFERGKKIHALAHYYLKGDDIEKFLTTLTPDENEIWQRLMQNEYFQKTYVNSEYSLSARVNEYWIGGRIDAFMRSDKDYYILDYKTGSIPKNPAGDFQTMVYLICADEILTKGWGNDFILNFVYIDLKNNENNLITYDNTKKYEYRKKITDECIKITTTHNFPKNPSRCKFCEYCKFCS